MGGNRVTKAASSSPSERPLALTDWWQWCSVVREVESVLPAPVSGSVARGLVAEFSPSVSPNSSLAKCSMVSLLFVGSIFCILVTFISGSEKTVVFLKQNDVH